MRFFAEIVPAPIRTGRGTIATWSWHVLAAEVLPGLIATLVLSQLAATLSAATSVLLFPTVSQRFGGRLGRAGSRAFLIMLRGTPEFIAVYILLQLLGPSMLPAVIALGLHNGGIIGFLMGRHADALTYRSDAPRRQMDLYAFETLPRLYGQFMALVLYRYEIIVRESAIVGILGVKTLGYYVNADFYEFRFDEAVAVLVATAALSIAVDATSRVVRRAFAHRNAADPARHDAGSVRCRRRGIGVRAAAPVPHAAVRRQVGRPDRDLAVAAGDVEHVRRLAQAGHAAAQGGHQRLPFGKAQAEVRRARREIGMVQVVRLDAGFDEAAHESCQRLGVVVDAAQQHALADQARNRRRRAARRPRGLPASARVGGWRAPPRRPSCRSASAPR